MDEMAACIKIDQHVNWDYKMNESDSYNFYFWSKATDGATQQQKKWARVINWWFCCEEWLVMVVWCFQSDDWWTYMEIASEWCGIRRRIYDVDLMAERLEEWIWWVSFSMMDSLTAWWMIIERLHCMYSVTAVEAWPKWTHPSAFPLTMISLAHVKLQKSCESWMDASTQAPLNAFTHSCHSTDIKAHYNQV